MRNIPTSLTNALALLAGAVTLGSTHAADLTWRGTVTAWNGATAWTNGSGANTAFASGDNVWLTDSGLANSPTTGITAGTTAGTMNVSNSSGNYTVTPTGTGLTGTSLTKTNSGTLTFSGSATFASTSLQGGTLLFNASNFTGGAITVSANTTIGGSSAATANFLGTSILGSANLTVAPNGSSRVNFGTNLDTTSFTGTISASASGQVNVQGSSVNLASAHVNLSGNTLFQSLSNGSVFIGQISAGSSNTIGKGTNSATVTTYEIGALGGLSSIAGVIQNGGITTGGAAATGIVGLTKVGSGTLSLTGANTYTGATTLNEGTLLLGDGTSGSLGATATSVTAGAFYGNLASGNIITGSVTIGNSLGSGDSVFGAGKDVVGRFVSTSSLTLNSDSDFHFDLHSGSELTDTVTFGGSVALNGTFTLNDLNTGAISFVVNDSFTVLSGSALTGTFSNLANGGTITEDGITYQAAYNSTALTLTVTAVPEPTSWALIVGGLTVVSCFRRRAVRA